MGNAGVGKADHLAAILIGNFRAFSIISRKSADAGHIEARPPAN
jgi:hypothetical protein